MVCIVNEINGHLGGLAVIRYLLGAFSKYVFVPIKSRTVWHQGEFAIGATRYMPFVWEAEAVEMVVRDWLRKQGPHIGRGGIFKPRPRRGKSVDMVGKEL